VELVDSDLVMVEEEEEEERLGIRDERALDRERLDLGRLSTGEDC